MDEAIQLATSGTAGFHVSFDLDASTRRVAPGVGTPCRRPRLPRGAPRDGNDGRHGQGAPAEMVEVNPILDVRNATARGPSTSCCRRSARRSSGRAPGARPGPSPDTRPGAAGPARLRGEPLVVAARCGASASPRARERRRGESPAGLAPGAAGVPIVPAGAAQCRSWPPSIEAARGRAAVSRSCRRNALGANLSNLLLRDGMRWRVAARASSAGLGEQRVLIGASTTCSARGAAPGAEQQRHRRGRLEHPGDRPARRPTARRLTSSRGRGERRRSRRGAKRPSRLPHAAVAWRDVPDVGASATLIYVGARYTISSLETIALRAGVSRTSSPSTLLSMGTTLPELVASATAARAGKADVAVGKCSARACSTPWRSPGRLRRGAAPRDGRDASCRCRYSEPRPCS